MMMMKVTNMTRREGIAWKWRRESISLRGLPPPPLLLIYLDKHSLGNGRRWCNCPRPQTHVSRGTMQECLIAATEGAGVNRGRHLSNSHTEEIYGSTVNMRNDTQWHQLCCQHFSESIFKRWSKFCNLTCLLSRPVQSNQRESGCCWEVQSFVPPNTVPHVSHPCLWHILPVARIMKGRAWIGYGGEGLIMKGWLGLGLNVKGPIMAG